MIFGNYSRGFNNVDKINKVEKAQKAESQDTVKQELLKEMYDKIRLDVPENGKFDTVVKEFSDPFTGDEYRLFITPSHLKGEDNKRRLNLGVRLPESGNMKSLQIMKGTKVEILDYIGNQKNASEIASYVKVLKEASEEE